MTLGTRTFNAKGGHEEVKGLSSIGSLPETVAAHRHEVEMNLVRFDVGLKYQINNRFRLDALVPYEIKNQEASVDGIENIVDPEVRRKILLYQNIHHRDATYQGFSDLELLLAYSRHSLFHEHGMFTAKIGTTIPVGKTEEDPWILGDKGLEHLHLQFGTGTFNPIADLHYSLPLYGRLRANASIRSKVPFYENSKTFKGSWEVTYTGGLTYQVADWLSLQSSYLGLYQSYAHWDGEIDINTGLRFSLASLGASIATPYNVPLSITFMLPIQQETLWDDSEQGSDAFKLGSLVSLTANYSF